MRDLQHLSTAFDDAVTADQKSTIQLCDFLGVFLNAGIQKITVFLVVSSERVDTAIVGVFQHFAGISDNK